LSASGLIAAANGLVRYCGANPVLVNVELSKYNPYPTIINDEIAAITAAVTACKSLAAE